MSTPVVTTGTMKRRAQSLGALLVICASFLIIVLGLSLISTNEFVVQGGAYLIFAAACYFIRHTEWFRTQWLDVGRMNEEDLDERGLTWFDPKYLVTIGAVLSLASTILGFAMQNQFGETSTKDVSTADVVFLLLFLPILGPIVEEWLCRGVAYPMMRYGFSMIPSMLVVNVLFAALHIDVYRLIPTFVVGMVVTYIYEKSRQLHNAIFIHITHNMVSIPLALMEPLHHINIVVASVLAVALWVFVIWQLRSIMNKSEPEQLNET